MSEKRFEVVLNEFDEVEYIMDKELYEDRDFVEFMDFVEDLGKENERLKEENERLKQTIQKIADIDGLTVEQLLESVKDVPDEVIIQYLRLFEVKDIKYGGDKDE